MSEQTLHASPAAQATDALPVRAQVALFLKRCGIMVAILAAIHGAYTVYLLQDYRYADHVNGKETLEALIRSLTRSSQKVVKLLIGDSVARQLYPVAVNNDTLQSIACNQAISLAGHYFLLQNFLESHPPSPSEPYEVVLVYNPFSFCSNLDQPYTYHYFVKNFYCQPYQAWYSPEVTTALDQIPYKWLSQNPFIYTTNWSPNVHFAKHPFTAVSPINHAYLIKIAELCQQRGLRFRLEPPLVSKAISSFLPGVKAHVDKHPELKPIFGDYFQKVRILPDSLFLDQIHLKKMDRGRNPLGI